MMSKRFVTKKKQLKKSKKHVKSTKQKLNGSEVAFGVEEEEVEEEEREENTSNFVSMSSSVASSSYSFASSSRSKSNQPVSASTSSWSKISKSNFFKTLTLNPNVFGADRSRESFNQITWTHVSELAKVAERRHLRLFYPHGLSQHGELTLIGKVCLIKNILS